MKCPFCNASDSKVLDKRDSENGLSTRRRRECLSCEKRFTTYERVDMPEITVVKKNGTREKFERQKVTSGIQKACQKRPVSQEKIEEMVDEIEAEIRNSNETEIKS